MKSVKGDGIVFAVGIRSLDGVFLSWLQWYCLLRLDIEESIWWELSKKTLAFTERLGFFLGGDWMVGVGLSEWEDRDGMEGVGTVTWEGEDIILG